MDKYLVNSVETWRFNFKEDVDTFKAEQEANFNVTKFVSEHKETKSKGEVVDEYYLVTIKKVFNEAKDPYTRVDVNYEVH